MHNVSSPNEEERVKHVIHLRKGVTYMIRYEIDGDEYMVLTQKDFYPPADERCYESGIDDEPSGYGYYDYAKDFWNRYGEDLYDDPLSYEF